jgi:hypothetical protein
MNQLNLVATFTAATVLTMFGLTCWLMERPTAFDPSIKAEQTAFVHRQTDALGGMFGAQGPKSLRASADGKLQPDHEYVLPARAVSR